MFIWNEVCLSLEGNEAVSIWICFSSLLDLYLKKYLYVELHKNTPLHHTTYRTRHKSIEQTHLYFNAWNRQMTSMPLDTTLKTLVFKKTVHQAPPIEQLPNYPTSQSQRIFQPTEISGGQSRRCVDAYFCFAIQWDG